MTKGLVLHKKHSGYGDTIGETYVFPIGIANSRQVKVNDIIIFCLTKKSADSDKRILGYGRINSLELRPPLPNDIKNRGQYAAHLTDYIKFDPPLSFEDIGGDPRTNFTNSISRVDIDFENYSSVVVKPIMNDDFMDKQYYARSIRRGQLQFREELLKVYDYRCAITGHGPDSVLEACHILPHSESGNNQLENGLILRADIHNLFDDGLLKINPKTYKIELDSLLLETPYALFNGQVLVKRKDGSWPSQDYLLSRYKD